MIASALSVSALNVTFPTAGSATKAPQVSSAIVDGTGSSIKINVNTANLAQDVKITAPDGFSVSPSTLAHNSGNAEVTVTLNSTLAKTEGKLILRSGDIRAYVNLTGIGTPLTRKNLSENPLFSGSEKKFEDAVAFTPGENGYTIEFRAKTSTMRHMLDAYAVDARGAGFKSQFLMDAFTVYNASNRIDLKNPSTSGKGGSGKFYNNDNEFHTYRFAVTPDSRIFVYRDGLPVDTLRSCDYGHTTEMLGEDGAMSQNLLVNGDFERAFGDYHSGTIHDLTGWHMEPFDQYNCPYEVVNREINNELDHDNHVLKLTRYCWNDGWAAGTVSQVVDVVPGEEYFLTFTARGGNCKPGGASSYENMGYVIVEEVQNTAAKTKVVIDSDKQFKEYSTSFTPSADCHQVRVVVYQERFLNGGGYNSSNNPLEIDEMVLAGKAVKTAPKAGFVLGGGTVEYFTYDITGAYAPEEVDITLPKNITLRGTGDAITLNVNSTGLHPTRKITVTAPNGIKVFPTTLYPNEENEVTISLESTLDSVAGDIIFRSGDVRRYVPVLGLGSALQEKDLSNDPVYAGGPKKFIDENFAPKGAYTVEFRMKNGAGAIDAFGVSEDGTGFKTCVNPTGWTMYNSDRTWGVSNPATNYDGGNKTFYNNDGLFHTYRFAVTADKRIFVYRDGLAVDTLRVADFGHAPEWLSENGKLTENLIYNPGFENEFKGFYDGTLHEVAGWTLDPFDQWNCKYDVVKQEIDNTYDLDNNVLQLTRYNWNDGWGAGTASQVVDVVPGEEYFLSFTARGGNCKPKGKDTYDIMGSVRIEEVQNPASGTIVKIDSDKTFKEFSTSYKTSADCNQLRVIVYQERFTNGGGWGSSVNPLEIDQVKLTGIGRKVKAQAGIKIDGCEVEYFNYDTTGAYAPLIALLGDVKNVASDADYAVSAIGGMLTVAGAEGRYVAVYTTAGAQVFAGEYSGAIALPSAGLYLVQVEGKTTKVVNL